MTSSDLTRVQEEIKAVRRLSSGRITLRMENGKVLVALPGPKETPWANGLYSVVIGYPSGKNLISSNRPRRQSCLNFGGRTVDY